MACEGIRARRPWTSYCGIEDWQRTEQRQYPSVMDTSNYSDVRPISTPFYKPFVDNNRNDEFYKKYLQLAKNVAYKYPNYGSHIERQGKGGASWRHVKDVQGYNDRVLYVDGRVRLYEKNEMPRVSQSAAILRRSASLVPIRTSSHSAFGGRNNTEEPWKQMTQPIKYKGFYNYKH